MKRLLCTIAFAAVFLGLGGCIYDPAYYHRSGVVYDDGYSTYSEPYYGGYYAPGYYYDPWYGGWGWPYFGFSYFGYYGGGHHHHFHGGTHGSTHATVPQRHH
jgi:hypothetical protein